MMENRDKETENTDKISWREQFEHNKKEIDFFTDTLDIRKNAIETYVDYNNMDSKIQEDDDSDSEESDDQDETDEEEGSTEDDDEETSCSITVCPKCGDKNFFRNHNVENVLKLFKQMMIFRTYLKENEK